MVMCDICGRKYIQNKDLLRHKREKHQGVHFPCTVCPSTFTRRATLQKHLASHNSPTQRRVKKQKVTHPSPIPIAVASTSTYNAPPVPGVYSLSDDASGARSIPLPDELGELSEGGNQALPDPMDQEDVPSPLHVAREVTNVPYQDSLDDLNDEKNQALHALMDREESTILKGGNQPENITSTDTSPGKVSCYICFKRFDNQDELNAHVPEHFYDPDELPDLTSQDNQDIHNLMDREEKEDPVPDEPPPDELEELNVLANAIFCARFTPARVETDVDRYIQRHRLAIENYLRNKLASDKGIKWYLTVRVRYTRELGNSEQDVECLIYHRTRNLIILNPGIIPEQIDLGVLTLRRLMEEFEGRGSGWTLDRILFLQVNIIAYMPLHGGTYFATPKKLASKLAILNIKNTDNKCFLWSVLAHLHPVNSRNHPNDVEKYVRYQDELETSAITFPVEIKEDALKKFERDNNLSINIFGYENEIFPLRVSSNRVDVPRQVDLLLLTEGEKKHFCLIRSLSQLMSDLTKHDGRAYYCRYCLHRFSGTNAEQNHKEHVKECSIYGPQKIRMPVKEPILEFKNIAWEQNVKFVIYADFESVLEKIHRCDPDVNLSSTTKTSQHIACGYSYVIVGHDGTVSKPVTCRGMDAAESFLQKLLLEDEIIQRKLKDNTPMNLTDQEVADFVSAQVCYICGKKFTPDNHKVRDHDHTNGAYRGAAHNSCNLKLKTPNFVPVFMHNLSRYDSHLIMDKIGLIKDRDIKCIPTNSETYISFSLGSLRFLDSIRFMPASLEFLVFNLSRGGADKFKCLNSVFKPEEVTYLLRKQVYPYDYFDDERKFGETELPPKEDFFNTLTDEGVSDEDYSHAQKVWEEFRIANLGEYHDLYVQTDVLLLADVFENFRAMCLEYYKLDCAHAFTGPGFAWQSALRMTGVKLELFLDPDMHLFIEKGIRGGVSLITHRLAVANNKDLPETYDPAKPSSYITYLECNNLFGTFMCHHLPMGGFRWLHPCQDYTREIILNHPDDDSQGFILEVDLEYPDNLHEEHNCYPLAPEKRVVKVDELSPFSVDQLNKLNLKIKDSLPKLIPTLYNREKYVLHYRNLKFYLSLGMKLGKIHKILTFEQGAWLKPFIEFNTEKRKLAVNAFEKDFFKLCNNSVFGKTMENIRNRINLDLVQTRERAIKKASSPTFQRFTVFKNDLVGIHALHKVLTLDRPIYTGFAILDLSKLIMYDFHYNTIRARYEKDAKLLFTDTDSLTYEIFTDDLPRDFAENKDMFDFSDYPRDHPLFSEENKKVLGKFKDELNGTPIQEFCGLRPKMYSILSAKGEKKTAKGICRRVVQKKIRHAEYKACLLQRELTVEEVKRIVSLKHEFFSIRQTKLALNPCDDKRYIIDGVSTYALGHCKIRDL